MVLIHTYVFIVCDMNARAFLKCNNIRKITNCDKQQRKKKDEKNHTSRTSKRKSLSKLYSNQERDVHCISIAIEMRQLDLVFVVFFRCVFYIVCRFLPYKSHAFAPNSIHFRLKYESFAHKYVSFSSIVSISFARSLIRVKQRKKRKKKQNSINLVVCKLRTCTDYNFRWMSILSTCFFFLFVLFVCRAKVRASKSQCNRCMVSFHISRSNCDSNANNKRALHAIDDVTAKNDRLF